MSAQANARGIRTRKALLTATREILEERGFEALTMAEVARRAGVTRRSVYLHFESRSQLVQALYAFVAENDGLADSLDRVWAAPDGAATLTEWAHHVARYHSRVMPVDRAIQQAHDRDEDAGAHRVRVMAGKRKGCERIFRRVADDDDLDPMWSVESATDMLMALTTSDVVGTLMIDCGWQQDRFAEHFAQLLRRTFLRSG